MDHDRAREAFTRLHEGELSDEEREQLERHLDECEECSTEWDSYRRTVDEVSGLLQTALPPDFARSVEQKIKKRSRGRFFGEQRPFSMQFAMVSFILILLFILAYLVLTAATEIIILDKAQQPVEQPSVPEKDEAGK
jgi:anti-sigma factor RsiW